MKTDKHNPDGKRKTFEELARELECDEDEGRFADAVKRIAKAPRMAKPIPKPKD